MIDLDDLRSRPEAYKVAARQKRINVNIDAFLALDLERRALQKETDDMRAKKNSVSRQIATMKGDDRASAVAAMQELSSTLKEKENALTLIEGQWNMQQLLIPSVPLPRVPEGKDDTENVEIRRVGDPAILLGEEPPSTLKDHVSLGETLDIIDIPRGVKIGGSRFYFLKGDGMRLEMAVLQFTIDHLTKKGFTPFTPPLMANYNAMMGTSYFPGGEEQAYAVGVDSHPEDGQNGEAETHITSDRLYLIGTSEVAVASYHSGETLERTQLPLRYCGLSNCFRREAGTYGKDTKGLYRIHQFQKVEQVILCEASPEESAKLHAEILQNAEEVLQALRLPYRVVDVCTGDMGRGQVYKNDIETWMPSRNGYGETHSCSTFYDYQARRLNITYKDAAGNRRFVHTLNNTCIASPRILIPILEMYQNIDGSVTVPTVLRPYMGGQTRIVPPLQR